MELPAAVKMSRLFSCWRLPGNQSSVQAKNYSLAGLYLTAKSEEDSEGSLSFAKASEAAKRACVLKPHLKHLDRSPCI